MKHLQHILMVFTVVTAASACDDSTTQADASTTPDAGSPTDVGTTPDTGSPTDAGTTPDTGGPTDASTGMVVVSGTYADNGTPVAGATIEVVGASPAVSTTTSATGAWSLTLTAGQSLFLRASKTGYRSVQAGILVPAGGIAGFGLEVVPNELPMQLFGATGITENTAAGFVVGTFVNPGDAGTLPAGFGLNLSAGGGTRIALGGGAPAVRDTTTAGETPQLIVVNVAAGTTTVTASAPAGYTCTPAANRLTTVRVDPQTLTFVAFECQ